MNSQLLTFSIDSVLFGIPLTAVKEIDRNIKYTHVPDSPTCILGLMNMRGQIVTLLHLGTLMESPVSCKTNNMCIVLKKDDNHGDFVGFTIDRAESVIDVDESMFEDVPPNLKNMNLSYIHSVVKLEEGVLIVINPNVVKEFGSDG